jgi:cbb3-type cytochrome oxidase subunit 3
MLFMTITIAFIILVLISIYILRKSNKNKVDSSDIHTEERP